MGRLRKGKVYGSDAVSETVKENTKNARNLTEMGANNNKVVVSAPAITIRSTSSVYSVERSSENSYLNTNRGEGVMLEEEKKDTEDALRGFDKRKTKVSGGATGGKSGRIENVVRLDKTTGSEDNGKVTSSKNKKVSDVSLEQTVVDKRKAPGSKNKTVSDVLTVGMARNSSNAGKQNRSEEESVIGEKGRLPGDKVCVTDDFGFARDGRADTISSNVNALSLNNNALCFRRAMIARIDAMKEARAISLPTAADLRVGKTSAISFVNGFTVYAAYLNITYAPPLISKSAFIDSDIQGLVAAEVEKSGFRYPNKEFNSYRSAVEHVKAKSRIGEWFYVIRSKAKKGPWTYDEENETFVGNSKGIYFKHMNLLVKAGVPMKMFGSFDDGKKKKEAMVQSKLNYI